MHRHPYLLLYCPLSLSLCVFVIHCLTNWKCQARNSVASQSPPIAAPTSITKLKQKVPRGETENVGHEEAHYIIKELKEFTHSFKQNSGR